MKATSVFASKLNKELKNVWNFTSLLTEALAVIALVYLALGYDNLPQTAAAIAAAVMATNILAKLYILSRQ